MRLITRLKKLVKRCLGKRGEKGTGESRGDQAGTGPPTVPISPLPAAEHQPLEREDVGESPGIQSPPLNPPGTATETVPSKASLEAVEPRKTTPVSVQAQTTSHLSSGTASQTQISPINTLGATVSAHPPNAGAELQQGASSETPQGLEVSEDLWDTAYSSLENDKEHEKLVEQYRRTLAKILVKKGANPPGVADNNAAKREDEISEALKDPVRRREHLQTLIDDGKATAKKRFKPALAVSSAANRILSFQDAVANIVLQIPQAAPAVLPWAGVCVGLRILSNPGRMIKSNLEGIAYVTGNMEWFCALAPNVLNQKVDPGLKSNLEQLKRDITELYKSIILYQVKSVCLYYSKQFQIILHGLPGLDSWDADIEPVKKAKKTFEERMNQFNEQNKKLELAQLNITACSIDESLLDINQTLQSSKHEEVIKNLYILNPKADMDMIKDPRTFFHSVCDWIHEDARYRAFTNWSDEDLGVPSCRLLWVKGATGTGKTMLLTHIISKFLHKDSIFRPSASFFFCSKGQENRGNSAVVVVSLMWMLLNEQRQLIPSKMRTTDITKVLQDVNGFYAVADLFKEMLNLLKYPVYFIVDALDECDRATPGQEQLVKLIAESLRISNKVRWLVSSQPDVSVLDWIKEWNTDNNSDTMPVVEVIEIDNKTLKEPLQQYIDKKLGDLAKREKEGYKHSILQDISRTIRNRGETTFLWVWHIFKLLEKTPGPNANNLILSLPIDLEKLYDRLRDRFRGSDSSYLECCKSVLVAASLAREPLDLSQLATLSDLPPALEVETIIQKCGSFLTTEERLVYLIHPSVREYVLKDPGNNPEWWLQPGDITKGHARIATHSIRAMQPKLKRDIYNLGQHNSLLEDITPPRDDPLTPIRYYCVYWLDHLRHAIKSNPEWRECLDNAYRFLEVHFLHWLESLSLLRKLRDAIVFIRELNQSLTDSRSTKLAGFLKDAERFTVTYGSTIQQAPLQIYGAALVFCPTDSRVSDMFGREKYADIPALIGINKGWDQYLQTLTGHGSSVNAVAFSPDGTVLASASSDRTVRLWDGATGAYERTLGPSTAYILAIAFSPDGEALALGFSDHTVQLWHVQDRRLITNGEGHSDWVNAVSFSPDGDMLASASSDHSVRLWSVDNEHTLSHKRTINGHAKSVNAVTFLGNGKLVVSASSDGTIKLWGTDDHGSNPKERVVHGDRVTAIALSPNKKVLASGASDHTIKLWNVDNWTPTQKIDRLKDLITWLILSPDGVLAPATDDRTGFGSMITSVTFSTDGVLAWAADDWMVRLCNTEETNAITMLKGHGNWVNAVTCSPNGKVLASASSDGTVRVWDATMGAHNQKHESHGGSVTAIAFSTNGQRLASTSSNGTVWLWDVSQGASLLSLHKTSTADLYPSLYKIESCYALAVAFSPNGSGDETIATAMIDGTVRLWDGATGAYQRTLQGHRGYVFAIAFSPDGGKLASGSGDWTVRLWDVHKGNFLKVFEGHRAPVRAVAFSPDAMIIASASTDGMVRLWYLDELSDGQTEQTGPVPPCSWTMRHCQVGQVVDFSQRLEGHQRWIRGAAFSGNGNVLALAATDGTISLLDVNEGSRKRTLENHEGYLLATAISLEGAVHEMMPRLNLSPKPSRPTPSPLPVVTNPNDRDDPWETIRMGISSVLYHLEGAMTIQNYMTLWRAVQDYGSNSYGPVDPDYNRSDPHGYKIIRLMVLYERLKEFLAEYLEQVTIRSTEHTGEMLLDFYNSEWLHYLAAAKCSHNMLGHLNRHWNKHGTDEHKYNVYNLHLVMWRDVFLARVLPELRAIILNLIEEHRYGKRIDYHPIKQALHSFFSRDIDSADGQYLTYYRANFEEPFLQETKEFYTDESKQFISGNSAEYMKRVEECLDREDELVRSCLHPDTATPLRAICNQVLVTEHANMLRSGFRDLFHSGLEDDMARTVRLLSCTPDDLALLLAEFEASLRKAGLAFVLNASSVSAKLKPELYVGAVPIQHNGFVGWHLGGNIEGTGGSDDLPSQLVQEYNNSTGVEGSAEAQTLSISQEWVVRGGENLLYLPPSYRATCAAFSNNVLVLGHESGRVSFLKFSSP